MDGIITWSRSIVISVIITVVIEMILPENNSKKYIKIVLGIFIVYSIISPVFEFFSGKGVDEIIDKGEAAIQASSSTIQDSENQTNYTDSTIRDIYSKSLVQEIHSILQNNGFIAEKIEIAITNDNSYNIDRIDIKIKGKNNNRDEKQVQSVVETVKQIVIKCDDEIENDASVVVNENDIKQIKELIKNNFRC